MTQKRMQFSVMAVAALAIVAVAAVMLLAGGNPAQARVDVGPDSIPANGMNPQQQSAPEPCDEESSPGPNTKDIISEGYYPVFDAWWVEDEGHLSMNFCPPLVTETVKFSGTTYTRHDANIHIRKTAFAIPNSYEVSVVDSSVPGGNPSSVEDPKIDLAYYPFLKRGNAVSAVETNDDGETVYADAKVWWVRLDQPWTDANETSDLQIGFSTDLLEEADWYLADGDDQDAEPDAPVQFEYEAVHVYKDRKLYTGEEVHELGAHMFAFDLRPQWSPLEDPEWSSVDTDTNSIEMFTDEYRKMQFIFTEPGSYKFQVHFKAHVRGESDRLEGAPSDWEPVSNDDIITSPVQWYTFHVGPQADLSTEVTAGERSTTGDVTTVPITVTANNSGPDAAENVEVEINLPPGLSAPATLPDGASHNSCGVIAWNIGEMAAPTPPATPDTPVTPVTATLTFNATVPSSAAGKRTFTAEIHSTTFDPILTDDFAAKVITLSGTKVRPPYFPGVTRSIVEHAIAGTHAGKPVAAVSPDGLPLEYTLSGRCHQLFQVHSNGQIVLAPNQNLEYEKQWEYRLTLEVKDKRDMNGAGDNAIDDSIPVTIRVLETQDEVVHPTVAISADPANPTAGQGVTLTATVSNLQKRIKSCSWTRPDTEFSFPGTIDGSTCSVNVISHTAAEHTYLVHIKWGGGGISGQKTVIWSAHGN